MLVGGGEGEPGPKTASAGRPLPAEVYRLLVRAAEPPVRIAMTAPRTAAFVARSWARSPGRHGRAAPGRNEEPEALPAPRRLRARRARGPGGRRAFRAPRLADRSHPLPPRPAGPVVTDHRGLPATRPGVDEGHPVRA